MSSLLYQASITLLLLPFLSFSTAELVVDTRDNPIVNGRYYYIIPLSYNEDSFLTYSYKDYPCQYYITPDESHSTPVKITSRYKTRYIAIDKRVSLAFIRPAECEGSLVWGRSVDPLTQKVYITTGGVEKNWSFSITKRGQDWGPFYELKYWPSNDEESISGNVGLYEKDGFLGFTEKPVFVMFKRAYGDNLDATL